MRISDWSSDVCSSDLNGESEKRIVIETMARLGATDWPIELTLASRDVMGFRMLLGREAIRRRFLIDPGRSFRQSERHPTVLRSEDRRVGKRWVSKVRTRWWPIQ